MIMRVTFFVIGAVLLIFCATGSINTIFLNVWGIKTKATVIEINSNDQPRQNNLSRANYSRFRGNRFITASYMINVQYRNKEGALKTQWTQIGPQTKRIFNVTTDAEVPFIYVPNSTRSMIGDSAPEWKSIIWSLTYLPLGLLMIILAIFRRKME